MPNQLLSHPDAGQLAAFLQGRLDAQAQAKIEQHVGSCDDCCRALRNVPDDTLAASVRSAGAAETMVIGVLPDTNPATRLDPPVPGIPPELVDHPRYRIVRELGKGGMGVVYLAEHRLMDRMVALKVINRRLLSSPTALDRFKLEFKAAAKLQHFAIVAAYDADQTGDSHFLVTEFVDGVSLHEHVVRKGPLPGPLACSLIRQAALGLQHASERGMVHRDIKPQNLMVTRKGQIKILDFGLARLAHQGSNIEADSNNAADQGDRGLTLDGVVLGTPDFIAPEQVTNSRSVDIRADIYSLGCTFYFLLTGQTPFTGGSSIEKAMAHVRSTPQPVETLRGDLPPEVTAIVTRMMAKKPADRYQTPNDVAQALSPFIKAAVAGSDSNSSTRAPAEAPAQPLDALLAAYPLPGQSTQPGYGFSQPFANGDPLGLRAAPKQDWKRMASRHRRVLAFGGSVCGLLLVVMIGWSMVPPRNGDNLPVAELRNNQQSSWNSPGGMQGDDAFAARDRKAGEFATPGAADKVDAPDVLLVIPHKGFWWKDYEPIERILREGGIKVVIASSKEGPAEPFKYEDGARQVEAQVAVAKADPQAYDAVVFIGGNVQEFLWQPENAQAARQLMVRMLEEGRWVTGMCRGTAILYKAGILCDHDAVWNDNIPKDMRAEHKGVRWDDSQPVIVSGQIVTGGSFEHAETFARRLVELLNKQ